MAQTYLEAQGRRKRISADGMERGAWAFIRKCLVCHTNKDDFEGIQASQWNEDGCQVYPLLQASAHPTTRLVNTQT